jgi:hypothetical protein
MPIRRYFVVIGPALAAFLWFLSSYLEPSPPVRAQPGVAAQAAKPAATFSVQPANPAAAAPSRAKPTDPLAVAGLQAEPQPEPQAEAKPPVEVTKSADATERPGQTARKHKQRKQTAQRRQRRNNFATAARRPSDDAPHYAGYQPNFFSPWQ